MLNRPPQSCRTWRRDSPIAFNSLPDGLKVYLQAVDDAFDGAIDYATIHKVYGTDPKAEETLRAADLPIMRIENGDWKSRRRTYFDQLR